MPSPNATTYQPVSRGEMIGWFNEWPQRIGHLFERVKLDNLIHDVKCLGQRVFRENQGKWAGMTIKEAMESDPLWEFTVTVNGEQGLAPRALQLFGIFQPEFGWNQESAPPTSYQMVGLTAKKRWVVVTAKSIDCAGIQLPTEIRIDDVRVEDFVQDYLDSMALAHDFIARLGNLINERQQYLIELEKVRWDLIHDTEILYRRMDGVEGVESQHCIVADQFAPDRRVGTIRRSSEGLHVLAWIKPGEKLCDRCARIYDEENCPYCGG